MPPSPPRQPDFTPWIVIVVLLGLMAGGLWLFPRVKAYVNFQDCAASGRIDCGPH